MRTCTCASETSRKFYAHAQTRHSFRAFAFFARECCCQRLQTQYLQQQPVLHLQLPPHSHRRIKQKPKGFLFVRFRVCHVLVFCLHCRRPPSRATARPLLFRTSSVARWLPKTASNEHSGSPSPCSPSSHDQRFAASTQRAELAPVADNRQAKLGVGPYPYTCVCRMKERQKLTALREASYTSAPFLSNGKSTRIFSLTNDAPYSMSSDTAAPRRNIPRSAGSIMSHSDAHKGRGEPRTTARE